MPRKSTTRNAQGAGTIRQRPDGRWEARYTTGRNPATGKQTQKSVYGATQEEVLKKLRQIQTDIDNGTYTEPNKITVSEWFDIWLAEYLNGVKSATVHSYTGHTKNHIKPELGAVQLTKLNPHMIQAFYNKLQREKGLVPKTIKGLHGVMHSALKQALSIGYIRTNPTEFCTLPRVIKKEMKIISDTDIASFIKAIKGQKHENIYFVDLFTGMRQSEILGLTWDCVDFKKNTILIAKQLVNDRLTLKYGFAPLKNDKIRKITPASAVMQKLME